MESENIVPSGRGKVGAPLRPRLIRREGRAGSAMPLLLAKVRSNNKGPEGASNKSKQLWEYGGRGTSQTQAIHSFQKWVLEERTVL